MELKKLPRPPLNLNATELFHYRRVGKMLIQAQTLRASDLDTLCLYARELRFYDEANESLSKEGQTLIVDNPNGVKSVNSLRKVILDCQKMIQVYQTQLGLTIKARVSTRLVTPPPAASNDDPLMSLK